MRKYHKENHDLEEVYCNKCGRKLKVCNTIIQEGIFSTDYSFGYFSEKDGETHSFDLCEACYDEMIAGFVLPVQIKDNTELL